jgi:hypothetical protein
MATEVRRRRGTTDQHNGTNGEEGFIGALAEVTVDTDKNTLVVHDNSQVGGYPLLREDFSNIPTSVSFTSDLTMTGVLTIDRTSASSGYALNILGSSQDNIRFLHDGRTIESTGVLNIDAGDADDENMNLNAAHIYINNNADVDGNLNITGEATASEFIGDLRGAVRFQVTADVAIAKGDALYISGVSGNKPTVGLADADDATKMPAFGLAAGAINANASGEIITFGTLSGIDTSSFTVGDVLYISTNGTSGNTLTATAPAGESAQIQNIGKVQRSHASAGSIKVGGAGRSNATPNLDQNKIFLGDSNNRSVSTALSNIGLSSFNNDAGFVTNTGDNTFVTSASFNTGDGVLTLTRNDTNTVTANLDGRYLQLTGGSLTGVLDFNNVSGRAITITADTYLDNRDASIYLGNATSSYGWDLEYQGSGSGNDNKLRFVSTNIGTPKVAFEATQDGVVNLPQSGATVNGNTIWHAGNDGSGSGLDADTLDGQHASAFLTSYTETDPVFSASPASGITSTNISNWNLAYNNHITAVGFNTGTGILTLTQNDTGAITTDLDGRYLQLSGGTITGNLDIANDLDIGGSFTNTNGNASWKSGGSGYTATWIDDKSVQLSRSSSGYVAETPYAEYKNFIATFSFKTSNSTHFGLTYNAQNNPANDAYQVIIRSLNSVRVQKRQTNVGQSYLIGGGEGITIPSIDVDDNNWHRVTVQVIGQKIKVDIDGAKIIDSSYSDTTFTSGSVGYVIYDGTVEFNNLVVQEIPVESALNTLNLDGISEGASDTVALMWNQGRDVTYRTLGSNAFNSTTIPTNNNQLTNGAGYITGYTETDPIFSASAASGITSGDIADWDSSYQNSLTGASFNTSTGIVTVSAVGGSYNTVSLDGRYYTESEVNNLLSNKDNYQNWTIADDGTATTLQVGSGNTLNIVGGTGITSTLSGSTLTISATNNGDITGVTAGSGLSGGGTSGTVELSHADTSSQASVDNSNGTVIQDVTLDTYGHITGLTSYNLDGRYLQLTGGTLTDSLTISSAGSAVMRITNTNASQSWMQYVGSNDDFIIRDETDLRTGLVIQGDGDVIMPSGNVGIGTASPGRKLHLLNGQIKFENTSTGSWAGLDFAVGNGTYDGYMGMLDNDGRFFIDVNSNGEDFTILQNGNVGIGTTSPSDALEIKRTGATSVSFALNQTGTGGRNYVLLSSGTGYGSAGNLVFYDGTASAERMRIDSSGNVKINNGVLELGGEGISSGYINSEEGLYFNVDSNNTPEGSLFVWGTGRSGLSGGTERMRIDGSGNVGIGTNSPTTPTHITKGDLSGFVSRTAATLTLENSEDTELYIASSPTSTGQIRFGDTGGNFSGAISYDHTSDAFLHYTNGTEKMRIDSSGRVGIGTTSPSEKLTVEGNISASGTIQSDDITIVDGTNDVNLYLANTSYGIQLDYSAGDIFFRTHGANRLTVDNDGNVGIGTTSPSTKLHIEGASAGYLQTIKNTTAGGDYLQLLAETGDAVFEFSSGGTGGEAILNMYRDGTQYVKISADAGIDSYFNNGNVGIGTASPSAKLDIKGDGADFFLQSNDFKIARIQPRGTGADLDKGLLSLFDGSTEDVRIDTQGSSWFNGGNVGIGTNSPDAPLTIHNSTDPEIRFGYSSTQDHKIQWDSSKVYIYADPENANGSSALGLGVDGSLGFYMDSSRNVGIGTTSPATRLDIQGVGGGATSPTVTATTGTNYIGWKSANTGGSFWTAIDNSTGSSFSTGTAYARVLWSNGAYPMVFSTNSTERMRIDSSGNVGIGVSPSRKLSVNGAADFGNGTIETIISFSDRGIFGTQSNHDLEIRTNGTERMRIDSSGNVGIGTTSPGAHLHIYGAGDEMLRLADNSATGNPYLSFYQTTTRRSFIQHHDTDDTLRIASEYGGIDFRTGIGGSEVQRMIIDSSGNVGIGNTSPAQKLVVNGGIHAYANITTPASGVNGLLMDYYISDSRFWSRGTTGGGTRGGFKFYQLEADGTNQITSFALDTSGNATFAYDVEVDGNVGIGTTSPTSKLSITDSATMYAALEGVFLDVKRNASNGNDTASRAGLRLGNNSNGFQIYYGGTTDRLRFIDGGNIEVLSLKNGGNVGIGTTSPSSKLEISGFSTGAGLKLNYGNSSGTIEAVNFIANGGANGVIGMQMVSAGVGDLWLGGSGGRSLTLYRDGNVGIGTTSPLLGIKMELLEVVLI